MKFRKPLKITSRTSSITNAFVQAIIPSAEPSAEEEAQALSILGMTPETRRCVYCGDPATDWDHLRSYVRKKEPSGYVNDIRNIVPSCGPCNQSKSGTEWKAWMQGPAPGSPRTRGIANLDQRIRLIEKFEAWGNVEPLPLRKCVGEEEWRTYWERCDAITSQLREAQLQADRIKSKLTAELEVRQPKTSSAT
jgi:hypothetical protein